MILVQNRVRTCSIRNCKEKYSAKGFCRHHYEQSPEAKAKAKERQKVSRSKPGYKAKERERKSTPEYKAKRKERTSTPEFKAKRKEQRATPEYKAKERERRNRPEVKAREKELQKVRRATPEYKAKRKEIRSRPENKAKEKAYSQTPKARAKQKELRDRPEVKARLKERQSTAEYKARDKKRYESMRLKVLQYYSKHLSNSDIPCCRCCGEKSHIEFLALDHIAGRKEMDSESELVKLGYSSSLMRHILQRWIIKNNFPKGFQVLCHNCNNAKGFYGKCPHQK